MSRNSRRNSSEKKQAREQNTKDKEKLYVAEHVIVEDSEPSSKVNLSNTKSDDHLVKENWDDEDPNDTDAERRQPHEANETPKYVHENDKSMRQSNKPSRKKRKKAKKTNDLQDHYDPEMEWEADRISDEILSTQSNTESKSTEDCDEILSKKPKKRKKSKKNHRDHDREMECQENKPLDDVPSTKPNTESNSAEKCNQLHSEKSKRIDKPKNKDQDHDRKVESQENKIPIDVPSTQPNNEKKTPEDANKVPSKKSKKKKKSKKNDQDHDRGMECLKNEPEDNDRKNLCRKNKSLDDVPSTKPNTKSNSTEKCNELHSEKSKRIDKPKNKDQDCDREVESEENKIPIDVPRTQSKNEKKTPEDSNKVPFKKPEKNKKSMKNDQNDREMECKENEPEDRPNNENELPKDSKKHVSKKYQDDSSNRKEKSRERDREYSTHRRNKSHKKDRDDSARRKDRSREPNREHSTERGNQSRTKVRDDFSHRKDHSQKDEKSFPHPNSHLLKRDQNSSRRKDEPQQRVDRSKQDDYYDRNSRNDQRKHINQRFDQNSSEDSYYPKENFGNYQDDRNGYHAGPSNRRNDDYSNENSYFQNKGNYEPSHRRQGQTQFGRTNDAANAEQHFYNQRTDHQNRNSIRNRENFTRRRGNNAYGRNSHNANNFQMSGQFKKKSNKQPLFVVNAEHYEPTIREIEGNLFDASEEYSLGHCVAEDFCMGAGIAIEFKKRFKGVNNLWNQNKRTGEVAILKRDDRFIFYLITKARSNGKPTIDSITKAIQSLKKHCLELNVKKLAIPRIGCGLDRLDWNEVKDILYNEFNSTDIEIVVYVL